MTRPCADLRCLHCGAAVSATALADCWCEECGKRLPSSFQDANPSVSRQTPAAVPEADHLRRQRLVCGGVILALVGFLALVFLPNLF